MTSADPTSDVFEVMRTARAIRRFQDRPVEDSILATCLEAATWAPSGGNQQPWQFVVLKSEQARRVVELGAGRALEIIQRVYKLARPQAEDVSPRARNARAIFALHDGAARVPASVLFCVREQRDVPPLLEGGSIYPCMQNFLLAVRASGLGACATGWHVDAEQELRDVVGIPPEWRLAALLVVGWPIGRHGPLRLRPLREGAQLDRWNNPLISG